MDAYSYIIVKRDRLLPNKPLLPQDKILFKFRLPYSIYLKYLAGKSKNREVLFCSGRYKGKLLGHEPWMKWPMRSVAVDPMGKNAMKYAHRPITEAELHHIPRVVSREIVKNRERHEKRSSHPLIFIEGPLEQRNNKLDLYYVKIEPPDVRHEYKVILEDENLFGIARKIDVPVGSLIYYNPHVDNIRDIMAGEKLTAPYYIGKKIELWFHKDSFLIYRYKIYDFFGKVYEDYIYTDIKLGKESGLTNYDFDKKNKSYHF